MSMKQVRALSNTIAEELQASLNARGIVLESNDFEARVGSIVASVYEAVEDTDKEDVVEDCQIFMATASSTIGGKAVGEGEYVEFEDTDEGIVATIFDDEGEVKEEGISVTVKEKTAFLANAEELEDDEEDYFEDDIEEGCHDDEVDETAGGVEEGTDNEDDEEDDEVDEGKVKKTKIKHGKKVKLTKNQVLANKLRKSGRLKKGYKLSADGKIVKMSSAERKARERLGRRLAKKGRAQRKKSLAKAQQIAAGSQSGSVKEGFDITAANGLKIAVDEGDILKLENNLLSVVREGNVIVSGIEVSEGFIQRCIDEEVITLDEGTLDEGMIEPEVNEGFEPEVNENEAAMLTFRSNQGYVLVKEGKELPMGNRIRARATLVSEGYQVTAEMLDKACNGELVTL